MGISCPQARTGEELSSLLVLDPVGTYEVVFRNFYSARRNGKDEEQHHRDVIRRGAPVTVKCLHEGESNQCCNPAHAILWSRCVSCCCLNRSITSSSAVVTTSYEASGT